jgi:hypothetical protein
LVSFGKSAGQAAAKTQRNSLSPPEHHFSFVGLAGPSCFDGPLFHALIDQLKNAEVLHFCRSAAKSRICSDFMRNACLNLLVAW